MGIEFRLLDSSGQETVALPDVESFSLSPILCDAGTVEFSYPLGGQNGSALEGLDEFAIGLFIDGERRPELDCLIKDVDGDDIEESQIWKFTGFFNNGRLGEAIVYPKAWPSVDPQDVKQRFVDVTPGVLLATLLQQAQSRGTLSGITWSFTGTLDSNGVAWDKQISIEYAPGVNYLTLLRNLYLQGFLEFEMVGLELRLYKAGTMSTDRTLGNAPLVFRKGRDLNDSPRKTSTRTLGTVMLAAGEEGLYLEKADSAAVASRRRIESSISNGSVTDSGTLQVWAEHELGLISHAKMEKTHGLVFSDAATPRPIRDFFVGDWAYSDTGKGLERLRIKQWVLSLDASGSLTGSVVLNDLFAEREELLARRIEGIVGGSTLTGASEAIQDIPADVVDNMAPATPQGLTASSSAYQDEATGLTWAQVSAAWLPVTTNADGTILEDLDGYLIRWQYEGETNFSYVTVPADATTATWSPVTPGVTIHVEVLAFDRIGNRSPYAPFYEVFSGTDSTPPEKPAAPEVDNYLGLLRVTHRGGTASGAAPAPDINVLEVHVGTSAGFTADFSTASTTRVDNLSRAGGRAFARLAYGATGYARVYAVDHAGNRSVSSDEVSGTVTQVVGSDIFNGAVGSLQLADLAVTNAKIANGAVNDLKVGSLSVGKLTGGLLSADVIVGGKLTTSATGTGKRAEMNAIGFEAWDSSGNKVISLDGANNLLVGKFQSALSGRRLEMLSGGTSGTINFIAPDGRTAEIGSFTGNNISTEALRIGMNDDTVSQFWQKSHWQDDGFIQAWSAINKITVGGGGTGPQGFEVWWTPDKGTPANPFFDNAKRRMVLSSTDFAVSDATGQTRIIQTTDDFIIYDKAGTLRIWSGTGGVFLRDANNYTRFDANTNGTVIRDHENRARISISDTDIVLRDSVGANGTAQDRIQISNTETDSAGGFILRDNTSATRLWIRGSVLTYWGNDDLIDMEYNANSFTVWPGVGDKRGYMKVIASTQYGVSPNLRLQTNRVSATDAAFWEGTIRINQGNFQFLDGNASAYYGVHTGAIDTHGNQIVAGNIFQNGTQVSSDMSLKAEIKTAGTGALDKVRGTRVTSYRRKGKTDARRELGLIAQEVPEELRGEPVPGEGPNAGALTVDLYAMAAMTWAAVQELAKRVDEIGGTE